MLGWILVGLLFIPVLAWPFSAVVSGTEITVAYDEPTTKADGSPLDDLDHTTIYYNLGHGPVVGATVPASQPAGGGAITQPLVVPVQANQEVEVEVWATASDTAGNESADSNHDKTRIDRLPPGPPQ